MNTTPRIPTLIGLLLLAVIIGSGIFIIERVTKSPTGASDSITPKNVTVSNVAETSATVSWTTGTEASGLINLSGEGGKSASAFDDRDTDAKVAKYITHHITIRDLSPGTQYEFTILSNGKRFRASGGEWKIATFRTNSSRPNTLEPAYGSILTQQGQPAAGALIYLTLEGTQTLSALTNSSGSWVIPLTLARTPEGGAYTAPNGRVTESITARLGDEVATATTDTLNDAPVPEMTIGKSYDFRKQQGTKIPQVTSLGTLISKNQSVLGSQTASGSAQSEISITAPSENASLVTLLPLIQGTGLAGKPVRINLSLPKQSGETTVGSDGLWRFTPKTNLAPGKQVLTVKTLNNEDAEVTLNRNFEILKSGTQVLGIATPSGTLTPTPTRRITSTPTPVVTPGATPSATLTPVQQSVPVTGEYSYTLFLAAIGILLITSGAALLSKNE